MQKPLLINDMPNSQYHSTEMKRGSISKSGLDQLSKSPAHFKWYIENPTEETPALVFGRAFHTMILEPEKVGREIVLLPDSWPTKKECGISQEDQKENFYLKHRGKAFLTVDMMTMAKGMAKSVVDHAAAKVVLNKASGKAEVTALWQDEETGANCRARFDWLRDDGLIVDLKTTRCAKPEVFERLALDHRYHVQAAFYMEAYRRATGKEPVGFAFVAVEKEPPYCACVYVAQPAFIELGRIEYQEDLALYTECMKKGEWPGYPEIQLVPLDLPSWAKKKLENN